MKTRPYGNSETMVEPDAILRHAAQVMNISEPDTLEVVDHLSEVIHKRLLIRAYPHTNGGVYPGKGILFLAVTFSVFFYVRARLCPEQDKPLCTELLLHAVTQSEELNGPMIVMLLDMGADVSDMNGDSPWKTLLSRVGNKNKRPIKSLATLDASRIAVVAMVANGAPIEKARDEYVLASRNRFGMREVKVTSSGIFTDGFFDELKKVKVTRKSKRRQQITKWVKARGKH